MKNENKNNYLIVDIGTGNVRVAITDCKANVLAIARENVIYYKDEHYPDSLYFDPDELWRQILDLSARVLLRVSIMEVRAITVSSQREGIVVLDTEGTALMGLPNHDHRGREWEDTISQKDFVYNKAGRYPSSLFSALKLIGLRERRPELYNKIATFLSISDWVQFKFSGIKGYEHSQASETLLYDVSGKKWSPELCDIFNINQLKLPDLHSSGTKLGKILQEVSKKLKISGDTEIIVGGADTQLAVKSTKPSIDDIVVVAGTTTPIVKLTTTYTVDPQQKTWTNRYIDEDTFILETNAGVTGLNYQRLKEIFYPKEDYSTIENEIKEIPFTACTASLGSLIAEESVPLTKGGFIFETPISHKLCRADFVLGALWDIVNCIKENYDYLCTVTKHDHNYIWGCGGGFQSEVLKQLLSDLLNKEIRFRKDFEHSSIIGGVHVCNESLGIQNPVIKEEFSVIYPKRGQQSQLLRDEWKKVRKQIKENFIK